MNGKMGVPVVLLVTLFLLAAPGAMEGQLAPPAGPNDAVSARFTLGDIWNRLATGATGVKRGATFVEPVAGPTTASTKTTDEIMAVAPLADNAAGATAADVASGKTFWGLRTSGGAWGAQSGTGILAAGNATAADVLVGKTFSNATASGVTGTMPVIAAATVIPGTTTQTIALGYHGGLGAVAGDANLVSDNIRAGTAIFGVTGNPNVVNTASGTATAAEVVLGKTAWVAGTEITGTAPLVGYTAGIPRTGLKKCYDASNVLTTCPGSPAGQDGALQKGLAYPNPRFTKNGNGTVTDNLTGLIWLARAGCFGLRTWSQALGDAAGLASGTCGLTDGSVAGDWRHPNIRELLSLVNFHYSSPAVSNAQGTGQWTVGDPFSSLPMTIYSTSTTHVETPTEAYVVTMNNGSVVPSAKTNTFYTWQVRGGP